MSVACTLDYQRSRFNHGLVRAALPWRMPEVADMPSPGSPAGGRRRFAGTRFDSARFTTG